MKARILKETFSIEDVSLCDRPKDIFLEIEENNSLCRVSYWEGWFKCLKIDTIYAFTSIDYGYFFFEEKLQKRVERSILNEITIN